MQFAQKIFKNKKQEIMPTEPDYSLYEGMKVKGGGTVYSANANEWVIKKGGGRNVKVATIGKSGISALQSQLKSQYHKALTSSAAWKEKAETKIKDIKMDIAYNNPSNSPYKKPLREHGTSPSTAKLETFVNRVNDDADVLNNPKQ